ncbi:MAG: carbamoyltransferase HypF, partial [Firmicutes bacterium]|nr:carbamoyltransferase HypF [Bacillota bacterium]
VTTAALRVAAKKSSATAEKLGLADIERACEVLRKGGVIAMKGVGGYNLIADPLSPAAVRKLREIKHREQKPFAVMFKDIETIKAFSAVNDVEAKLLESSAKPIILLEHKTPAEIREGLGKLPGRNAWFWPERLTDEAFAEIEKSRFVGSFLPSMGAQHLLLDRFGLLIVTSANLSDMPIIKDEDELFVLMDREPLIDGCLYNERDIRVRVDDSVARVIDGQPQMIRRSKGYAPVPLYITLDPGIERRAPGKDDMLLACGGQLKNSFALSKGAFSYISQYFGDLDSLENQKIYAENVDRMATMFRTKPQLVVCDMHPLYATTAFAESYAKEHGNLPIVRVQHHHAHVASVMAEHRLEGKVIGVSMDGTGYGTDGAIWGGEFLLCEGAEFKRRAHLKYVDMIGGDSSMKDAAKTSLCFREAYGVCAEASDRAKAGDKWLAGCDAEGVRELAVDLGGILKYAEEHNLPELKNPGEESLVMAAIRTRTNVIKSSSMGRLFDSVSALLGICPYNEYEGQCAILLEDAAARAQRAGAEEASEADRLALDFHMQVASLIYDECCKIREESGAKQVALTGGVFQNKILTEESLKLLREGGFDVYYNVSVSPNDGGIALGQNYIGLYHLLAGKTGR